MAVGQRAQEGSQENPACVAQLQQEASVQFLQRLDRLQVSCADSFAVVEILGMSLALN